MPADKTPAPDKPKPLPTDRRISNLERRVAELELWIQQIIRHQRRR